MKKLNSCLYISFQNVTIVATIRSNAAEIILMIRVVLWGLNIGLKVRQKNDK